MLLALQILFFFYRNEEMEGNVEDLLDNSIPRRSLFSQKKEYSNRCLFCNFDRKIF